MTGSFLMHIFKGVICIVLEWDRVGEREFRTGCDRAVLYPYDGASYEGGVAWNGFSGVDKNVSGRTLTGLYLGDRRAGVLFTDDEYGGTLRCYTYPDEFEACLGSEEVFTGVFAYDQGVQPFGLSYRTMCGDMAGDTSQSYDIHLIYNSHITSYTDDDKTIGGDVNPTEFAFDFTSMAEEFEGHRPTSHLRIHSADVSKASLLRLERMLYGSVDNDPYLPFPDEIASIFSEEEEETEEEEEEEE